MLNVTGAGEGAPVANSGKAGSPTLWSTIGGKFTVVAPGEFVNTKLTELELVVAVTL
jgi:hypothetical protein